MRAIKPGFLKWSLPSRSSSFFKHMSVSGAMETFQQPISHSFIHSSVSPFIYNLFIHPTNSY